MKWEKPFMNIEENAHVCMVCLLLTLVVVLEVVGLTWAHSGLLQF